MPFEGPEQPAVAFQVERFTDLRSEGAQLFSTHWREASADLTVPVDLAWDQYRQMEDIGVMLTVTARQETRLIGYVVYIIWPHLHYRTQIIADSDSFFIRPEDRRGWVGLRLFRFAEKLLRERGVHQVWSRVKLHVKPGRGKSDLVPLFEYMGYEATDIVLRKRLR